MFYLTTIKQEKTLIFKRIFEPQTGHRRGQFVLFYMPESQHPP